MLFCSTELAARIEREERDLCVQATRHAEQRGATGVFVMELAGGAAPYAGCDVPYSKVVGLGFAGPLDERRLEAVEQAYANAGAAVRVELSSLAEPSVAPLLSGRGYVLRGFENVLGRPLPPDVIVRGDVGRSASGGSDGGEQLSSPSDDAVLVLESPADQASLWLETVIDGFAQPDEQGVPSDESFPRDAIEAAMNDMRAVDGFACYLAYRRGEVAGGAGLRLSAGIAQLCGAATRPEHRRRGVQSALLSARLAAATRGHCEVAVVTTQPGSKSQQNAQKQGFSLLYTRAILVRPAP